MARQWNGKCVQCEKELRYAEQLALQDASLGNPPPMMCAKCIRLEAGGLRATTIPQVLIELEEFYDASPLGRIEKLEVQHTLIERPSGLDRNKFGVKDEEIQALYRELLSEDTPVVIAVAPTGSGKSTFVPYRLLVPDGLPLDTFTAGRQIVITQPRKEATKGIAGYVAKTLHGADLGVGQEVGYRVRDDHACDWRNRMVYVTDGTLINWIVKGELDRISLIIIDEAHERSLNIDVILGLLTNMLPQFPHLKVLIVSATINHEKFCDFFNSRLPGSMRCGVVECSVTKPVGLKMHWLDNNWGTLPYKKGALQEFGDEVWVHLADAIVRLVVEMDSPMNEGHGNIEKGDVLGFLHGARQIQDACDRIEERLNNEYPDLGRNTDVYPLYAAVDEKIRRKAIDAKVDTSRRRIVIASNAAETSLTIDSLVHVVDSGFIKQTQWDPVQEQSPLVPIAHSQAGCRQRWGRVGRTMEGFAWSLYTKEQFENIFLCDTVPEIQRSCLDGVILLAKRCGADRLNDSFFPWLDSPNDNEINSTCARLARHGYLDKDGDLTAVGISATFSEGEDSLYARLVSDADRFGFGIEAATLLPFLKTGLEDLFPDNRDWEHDKRRMIREAQERLQNTCKDDLELCLRVYQDWVSMKKLPEGVPWEIPAINRNLRGLIRGGEIGITTFKNVVGKARVESELEKILSEHTQKPAEFHQWKKQAESSLRRTIRHDWTHRNGIDDSILPEIKGARENIIRQIGAKKKMLEDRDIDFSGLERLRIIIARAFPGHIYVRAGKLETAERNEPRYKPFRPETPDAPVLSIGSVSCCRSNPPKAVVAIGPKYRISSSKGDAEDRPILLAPFIIAIDQLILDTVIVMSDFQLADYFKIHLPRYAIKSENDRRQKEHEALRRYFPPGMLVKCQVLSSSKDKFIVKVLQTIGWGGKRIDFVGMSGHRQEKNNDLVEKDFDFRYTRRNKLLKQSKVQSFGDDFIDPVDETIQSNIEFSSIRSQEYDKKVEQHDQTLEIPMLGEITGRLTCMSGQDILKPGEEVVAEIIRYTDLRDEPGLILASPSSRERFRLFYERNKSGDKLIIENLGQSPKGSFDQGLLVRDPISGLEMVIPTEDIVLFKEPVLLGQIPIGSKFSVHIESINTRYEEVSLTNHANLQRLLESLEDDKTYSGTVARIDYDKQRVYLYVVLDESILDQGIIASVKVIDYRERYEHNNQLSLPYKEGDTVHIKLKKKKDARSRTYVSKLTHKDYEVLENFQVTVEDGKLCTSGQMSVKTRTMLLHEVSSSPARDAVSELFLNSNELYGDLIITDIEQRFPIGGVVKGTVTWVSENVIKLALENGAKGQVNADEITWWEHRLPPKAFAKVGDIREAKVLCVDVVHQLVHLSFRQITANPWEGGIKQMYPPKKKFEGKVRNLETFGAFVTLEPGLDGLIYIRNMRSYHGKFVNQVKEVVDINDLVTVRVLTIDLQKKKLSLELINKLGKAPIVDKDINDIQEEPKSESKPLDWNNSSKWPWTEAENAIKTTRKPKQPLHQISPKCKPLEKRPLPCSWFLSWR